MCVCVACLPSRNALRFSVVLCQSRQNDASRRKRLLCVRVWISGTCAAFFPHTVCNSRLRPVPEREKQSTMQKIMMCFDSYGEPCTQYEQRQSGIFSIPVSLQQCLPININNHQTNFYEYHNHHLQERSLK